jgi:hypothetical protein
MAEIGRARTIRGRKGATGDQIARPRSQCKRRRRPPWGDLLGGKPIERQLWILGERTEWEEESLRAEQYSLMLRLKKHYGILGGENPAPAEGVAPADWLPWYQLALRIASDLDESLKIVHGNPPAKTAPRWRGSDGLFLLRQVDAIRETRPKRSIPWCLQEMQKRLPGLAKIPLRQLIVRYHEAKKHFGTTEQTRKQTHPS